MKENVCKIGLEGKIRKSHFGQECVPNPNKVHLIKKVKLLTCKNPSNNRAKAEVKAYGNTFELPLYRGSVLENIPNPQNPLVPIPKKGWKIINVKDVAKGQCKITDMELE